MSTPARKNNYYSERNRQPYDDEDFDSYRPAARPTPRVPNPNMRPGLPVYHIKGEGSAPIARQPIMPPQPLDSRTGYQTIAKVPQTTRQTTRMPYPTAQPKFAQAKAPASNPFGRIALPNGSLMRLVMWLGAAAVLALISFFVLSSLISWWQTWQDDMTYGRPRTMQVDAYVGHNEQNGKPSHFIAQNIDGQINIIQYPGNDTSKTRVIQGPKLFGKNAALAPVKVEFRDVNADGHVDLVANVDGQKLVYLNEAGNFRPIREDERSRIKLASGD